jgi:hypothetical protein
MVAVVNSGPLLLRFRLALAVFIAGLVLSGVTAFPLLLELRLLTRMLGLAAVHDPSTSQGLARWLITVREGLEQAHATYPWMAYGTDWLAFAHLVIAFFFIEAWWRPHASGPVLRAGVVACVGVLPLALICGTLRGIPPGWRLIDCSFGIFGVLPLLYCLRLLATLAREKNRADQG